MINNVFILIWIIVLAVILMSTPTQCNKKVLPEDDKSKEGFYTYYGYYKKYCPSCGWRSRHSCSKCTNCGWSINSSGYGECIPGDSKGSYFSNNTMYWEYGDPYYYYPYSHIFPVVKTSSIYPYYRWRLRKPRRWRKRRK